MPLLDHFHPPLKRERHWEGFHSEWAGIIVQQLNQSILPAGYLAEPHIKIGAQVEVDVATLEEENRLESSGSGVATAVYAPPQAALTLPIDFADLDLFEIQVQKEEGGLRLVAAIELVSPANKDRPSPRQAFIRKCATYLQENMAVLVVDIVTMRSANLHAELVQLLSPTTVAAASEPPALYAVAYRTILARDGARVEVWPEVLALGQPLPTLPLWLEADCAVPVDLEQSYLATCGALRIALA